MEVSLNFNVLDTDSVMINFGVKSIEVAIDLGRQAA
jgi:hypothetical protein